MVGVVIAALAGCGNHGPDKVADTGKPSSPAALDHMSLDQLQRLDQNPTLSPLEKSVVESKLRQRQNGTGATP
jgi:predicted small lipoprotein YifL